MNTYSSSPVASSKTSGAATFWTLCTAVGITAAAVVVMNRIRNAATTAGVDDILRMCDEAASKLDERLGNGDIALAS